MPRKTQKPVSRKPKTPAPRKARAIKVQPPPAKLKVQARADGLRVEPIRVRIGDVAARAEPMARPTGAHHGVQALDGGVTTIDVYDVIGGWGMDARMFRDMLKQIDTPVIRLRINSPGGSVFDAVAMYNDLLAHPARVEVQIVGLAASAASLLAMAGNRIEIADNAFFMIHNSWVALAGDRNELAKTAKVLERIDTAMRRTYALRTELSGDEIGEMMDAETWMDAGDAVAMGFADAAMSTADEEAAAQARAFDLSVYVNAPDVLKGSGKTATVKTASAAPAVADALPDLSAITAALSRLEATMKGSTLNAQHTRSDQAVSVPAA